MSTTRQTILASRPVAMVLALSLAAGLSAPFLLLPTARAAGGTAPPTPCAVVNNNGCTELSATPPEDTVTVPPNIVLMLDDSGSMAWDYMPDWDYLKDTSLNGVRDSAINGAYYNPSTTYTTPPKADGTSYPNSPGLTDAYRDGFSDTSTVDVTNYTGGGNGDSFRYYENLPTTQVNTTDHGPASGPACPNGYTLSGGQCISNNPNPSPVSPREVYKCNEGDGGPRNHNGQPNWCLHTEWQEGRRQYTWYPATDEGSQCPSGSTLESDGLCHFPPIPPKSPSYWCPNGGSPNNGNPPECVSSSRVYVKVFAYEVGNPYGNPATAYSRHYVAPGTDCDNLYYTSQKANCVDETDTAGVSAPTGVAAGQNVANWFSYYRTRMLMAKSGLMIAFNNLSPKYRFGFGSIDANAVGSLPSPTFGFDDSAGYGTGSSSNKLSEVQPFGDGSSGTQRAAFWKWLVAESPSGGTPLRKALNAVGLYYQSSQPWTEMSSDPGYTPSSHTQNFACRASYAILTTDGFWNGNSPGVGNADETAGTQYTAVGGTKFGYTVVSPFAGSDSNTLADVANYYWKTDLNTHLQDEVASSKVDPAFWQHMTTFTMGLGFSPTGIQGTDSSGNPVTVPEIFAWANDGGGASSSYAISGFKWPTPSGSGGSGGSENNIADLAHAAVNGHGDFFSVKSPQQLAAAFAKTISEIQSRNVTSAAAAVNASVTTTGALSFSTSYNTGDWSGQLDAVTLGADGQIEDPNNPKWAAETQLDTDYHSKTGYGDRKVYTDAYKLTTDSNGIVTSRTFNGGFQFNTTYVAKLDGDEVSGLETPALAGGNDTLDHRIDYLLGDNTYEGTPYRSRTSLLGAIIHSQPVYVSYPSSGYYNNWPSGSPEIATGAESYDSFQSDYANRLGMVYVGANDGMLHAFAAPAPVCNPTNVPPCTYGSGGKEEWAFIPRAVYANLGNLTTATDFQFLPTVDATPVTRDVFFGEKNASNTDNKWHTMLVGGVGLGGRGVYALDITGTAPPNASDPATQPNKVLWEFDADMTMTTGCVASYGTCNSSDLGYTISQPNIGRVQYKNKWVVLVPNGYFPDCTTPDTPTANLPATNPNSCDAIAKQAPKDSNGKPYSALFVLDAQTGDVIAELKTPTITGVTSFGLATPVMGNYEGGQVDEVAFAGDVEGNLWRFDLKGDPSDWTVTLAYKGVTGANGIGLQPITTMPRLFPDPTTNRFMVVFGTGKYLGVGDNVTAEDANGDPVVQAIYGIRDQGDSATSADAYSIANGDLVQQYLSESVGSPFLADGVTPNPLAGVSVRCITGSASGSCASGASDPPNTVPAGKGGWYFNLKTTASGTQNDAGERVVVTPGAIFASNTAVIQTLITGGSSSDPCHPSTQGAVFFINAVDGGPGTGVSSLGGYPAAGARVDNARTSGSLPIMSALGGGQVYVPGMTLTGSSSKTPITGNLPIWRRRSWQEINQNQ